MSELNEEQLAALERERAQIFMPRWFGDLLGARLGFGDTFWLGLFGVLMFVVPGVVLISGLLYAQATALMVPFLKLIAGLYALWALLILRALITRGGRGGWAVTGYVLTVMIAAGALLTAATL
ncbi:hypothetical protein [Rhodobacter lacus]|uniref:Uncharacterized protein n=1 Tax=Rhodobacter lacus TaxID=1641972 RepID=A0ABW5AAK9_9RHOB